MIKSTLLFMTLALLSYGPAPAPSQDQKKVVGAIERVIKTDEPEWDCTELYTDSGVPAPEAPRGVSYHFQCKRQEQFILGYVFYGESKQDAVRKLEWSQRVLQINESKPLAGVGEGAYQYGKGGSAWITFRKLNVFGQLNVRVIDPRKVEATPSEMDAYTAEALEVARRFAQHIAEQIPAP